MKGKLFGIAGNATVGKDTFYKLVSKELDKFEIRAVRVALADELKNELSDLLKDKLNIDIWNCSNEQKTLIRPLLVAWGKIRRDMTQGTHWTSLVQEVIKHYVDKMGDYVFVTDIRYANPQFPNDEYNWLKGLGGKLIYIDRYTEKNTLSAKKYVFPANEDERINNEILKKNADFCFEWPTFDNMSELGIYVDKAIDFILNK